MPLFQEVTNFDKVFHQLSDPPIIINDLLNSTEDAREDIKELITSRYSSDMISLLPSCRCGITKGEFSKKTLCQKCNTPVKAVMENDVEPIVWFRRPNGVEMLINPAIWLMLSDKFRKGRFDYMNWLVDNKYDNGGKKPDAILKKLLDAGIQRSYNYFVRNFDYVMEVLFSIKELNTKSNKHAEDPHARLHEMIKRDRHLIFSEYIPIPNKTILVIEKTVFSTYVDQIVTNAVNYIQMLVSIDRDFYDQTEQAKEKRTIRGLIGLYDFYFQFLKDNIAPKKGQIRRHILGSRTNFSGRAVITSITQPHEKSNIEMPWGMGLAIFREHLLNKLGKLGMTKHAAVGYIYAHIEKFDQRLHDLLTEIISEFENGQVPLLLNRNPSLLQGSILSLTIPRIKKNPRDRSIGLSILVVRSLNADFDGDEVNIALMLDKQMADAIYPFDPKFSIYDLKKPMAISGNVGMSKPACAAIAQWLEG